MLSQRALPPSIQTASRILLRLLAFGIGMTCLCLAAIHTFSLNQMPHTADGLLHLYRSVAVEHSLHVDHPFWPRFSSGLAYGYGAPLFNFFPPLAYYPASLAHSLGLSFLDGWLFSMCLYTVLAGTGMALLGRLWTRSELGGWIAAAAYVYSPYLLFDSVTRGATAELAALAALPFAFYGTTRLAFTGGRRDFLLALIALSLFIPLHTVITLHGAMLLALFGLFLIWRAHERRSVFFRLALLGALALMLTAFYWLPALAERETIKLPLIAEQLGHIDVTRHLRPLSDVLAPPQTADPTQQNRALPISLGWPQLILAAIGTALSLRARHRCFRPLMIALAVAVGFLVFLNTLPSAWFWENIPLISFTQFPWRTLGLASLLLALMSAVGARLLWQGMGDGRGRLTVISVIVTVLLLYSLPWTFARFHKVLDADDIRDVQRFEREGGQLALSSYAEYLPLGADAGQLDADRLTPRFDQSDAIPRLLPSPTVDILAQEWQGTSAALRLSSAEAQTLVFDWLYVPGWIASIDGEPVDVFPAAPSGLVALAAPAGELNLRLSLAPTAAQSLAGMLGALGLAGAILTMLLWRRLMPAAADLRASLETESLLLPIVAAIGIAVFSLKALALDAVDSPFRRSRFGQVEAAVARANFDDAIDLLAVEAPTEAIKQSPVKFKLFWRLRGQPSEKDFSSIIRMRDPQGLVVAEAGSFAPGGLATRNWLPGAYIEDVIILEFPVFTPPLPEAYRFDVSLYDSESLRELSLRNAAGDPQDVKYEIASLPLRLEDRAMSMRPLPPSNDGEFPALLFDALELPNSALAGDTLRFSWTWQKLRSSESEVMARLLWLDESGREAAASPMLPLVIGYDFSAWPVGEVNRGQHRLILPARLPAGRYRLGIRPLDAERQPAGEIIQLDQVMTVSVPKRDFSAPRYDIGVDAAWSNGIILHGFSLRANGAIELVWGAKDPLGESLRLFVHALDDEGSIAAQWDGVPVDWTRPTSGWIQGEFVSTEHRFSLPAGQYRLRLGWYNPLTGQRINTAGADALELEQILVIE